MVITKSLEVTTNPKRLHVNSNFGVFTIVYFSVCSTALISIKMVPNSLLTLSKLNVEELPSHIVVSFGKITHTRESSYNFVENRLGLIFNSIYELLTPILRLSILVN